MKLFKVDCLCDKSGNKKRFSHCIQAKSGEAAIKQLMDTLEEDGNDVLLSIERGDDYVKLMFFDGSLCAHYYNFTAEEIVLKRDTEHWVPYEDSHNISQKDYDKLLNAGGTEELTDDEAIDLVCEEFGFNKDEVKIIHSVGVYEKDTFSHRLRKIGETERKPLYNATDWNYVCFSCVSWAYEMYNGELHHFHC